MSRTNGVTNGQLANQDTFNNGFVSRGGDTDTVGKVDLLNSDAPSGPSVTNSQREINSLNSFTGRSSGSVYNAKPTWTSNEKGSPTDDLVTRTNNIDGAFNNSTGHAHDGSTGGGVPIDAGMLASFNNYIAELQTFSKSSVSGTSVDITTEMSGKVPGGGDTSLGVYTTPPGNDVTLSNGSTQDQIIDGSGNGVYGRITESTGTWTLSFYVLLSGVETAYSLPSQNINVFFAEVFTMGTRPTRGADTGLLPSLNFTADVIDASATQSGKVNITTQTLGGLKTFQDGIIAQTRFQVTGKLETDFADDSTTGTGITLSLPSKELVRLTSGSLVSVAGITAPTRNQKVRLINRTGIDITIVNNATATAANRILTGTGVDQTLKADSAIDFVYDTTTARWQASAASTAAVTASTKSIIRVDLLDNVSTTLPSTGAPVTIDNVTVTNDMLVVFTAFSSGNNKIYKATVSGGNVTAWTLQSLYDGSVSTPTVIDQVGIRYGDLYQSNQVLFDGAQFNNLLDNKVALTLLDNKTNEVFLDFDSTIFENVTIEYSISRSTARKNGTLRLTTNGSSVNLVDDPNFASIGTNGVTFSAALSGSTCHIRYSTTSTGTDAVMKKTVRIWK